MKHIIIGVVTALLFGLAQATSPNAIVTTAIPLKEGLAVSLQDAEAPSCSFRGKVRYISPDKHWQGGWAVGISEYACSDGKGGLAIRSFAGSAFLKQPVASGDRLMVIGQAL